MTQDTTRRLLSEAETAEMIGMSRGFLRRSRMEGRREGHTLAPPWIQIGRTIRYDLQDVTAWIEARKVRPTAPQAA